MHRRPDAQCMKAEVAKAASADLDAGASAYQTHLPGLSPRRNGSGLRGAFPPLKGQIRSVGADGRYVAVVILGGPIRTLEVRWRPVTNGVMPRSLSQRMTISVNI